ncbi:uncharacterized protein LOC141926763 [Strix aluco]|uniref:uncharacterized protein LOC141926763 n=1 Tax=Strix aluco TaxID=111821 RepID=UPI003DA43B4F
MLGKCRPHSVRAVGGCSERKARNGSAGAAREQVPGAISGNNALLAPRGTPGAVVFAHSAARQLRRSRARAARHSPRYRRGPVAQREGRFCVRMRGGVSRKCRNPQALPKAARSACVTPSAGEDSQATGVSEEEEGQEEGRRKKHLTRQILPAVPRTRAAFQGVVGPDELQEFPSHLKPFCSSGVTAVTSRAVSYHRPEKVAPGFKAIPSACCFTPAAALLKKRRRKLWLTKLCHNRDCSRQHHGMLIMTSTGLAELSFSLLLAMDLQWPLIHGKRLYSSKWSYNAGMFYSGRGARGFLHKPCTPTALFTKTLQSVDTLIHWIT